MAKPSTAILLGVGGITISTLFLSACTLQQRQHSTKPQSTQIVSGQKTSDDQALPNHRKELMSQNNPTIKKLSITTADYIGQSFTLYGGLEATDYYNYGFSDENKYYSLRLWDVSVEGNYEGVYAYIDKTDPSTNAKAPLDLLLSEDRFVKVEVTVPSDKSQSGGNSFLEVTKWEVVK